MRKHILGSIVLGAVMALASLAAHADDTINFGVAAEPYPPFTSKDASGKWVGFEIDLMDAVCAQMKAKCELVETAWDGIIPALQEKKIDVIWSSMSITDERKQKIDFTDRYYKTPAVIIGPKSEEVKIDFSNPDSVKGKIIGVQISTIHANFVQKYFGSTATIKTYDTQDNCNADLVAGRVDLVMADFDRAGGLPEVRPGQGLRGQGDGAQGSDFWQRRRRRPAQGRHRPAARS